MLKRCFDVLIAGLVLLLTAPLWLVITLLIRIDSSGPTLHRAVRVGRHGKPFTLYKFRTMSSATGPGGPRITQRADPRITGAGRWLRRTKLDEIPQLLNVLKGEMSMVGPRPEDPLYVQRYTVVQRRLLEVRPGLTSPATLAYRHEESLLAGAANDVESAYLAVVLPRKLSLDLDYLQRRSFLSDLGVLARTVAAVVRVSERRQLHPSHVNEAPAPHPRSGPAPEAKNRPSIVRPGRRRPVPDR